MPEGNDAGAGYAAGGNEGEEKVRDRDIRNLILAPDMVSNFEKETGIKVSDDSVDGSNWELDAELAPGNSGHDVAVRSAFFASSAPQRERASSVGSTSRSFRITPNMNPKSCESNGQRTITKQRRCCSAYAVDFRHRPQCCEGESGTRKLTTVPQPWKPGVAPRPMPRSWGSAVSSCTRVPRGDVAMSMEVDSASYPNSQDPEDIEAGAATLMKIARASGYVQTDPIRSPIWLVARSAWPSATSAIYSRALDRAPPRTKWISIFAHPSQQEQFLSMPFDSDIILKDDSHPDNAHDRSKLIF